MKDVKLHQLEKDIAHIAKAGIDSEAIYKRVEKYLKALCQCAQEEENGELLRLPCPLGSVCETADEEPLYILEVGFRIATDEQLVTDQSEWISLAEFAHDYLGMDLEEDEE